MFLRSDGGHRADSVDIFKTTHNIKKCGFSADVQDAIVICREMRKAPPLAGNMCYSMEIKGTALSPWVVSGSAMMTMDTDRFDVMIVVEPSFAGFNVALTSVGAIAYGRSRTTLSVEGECEALGVPGTVLVPSLCSALLQGLGHVHSECLSRTIV